MSYHTLSDLTLSSAPLASPPPPPTTLTPDLEASSAEAPEEEEASPVAPPCTRISSRNRLWEEAEEEPRLRRRACRSSRAETASVARLALGIKMFMIFLS